MRKAIIVDPGREYPNYRIFAIKIGYPEAAVDLEDKDERRPLIKGEEVTILAEGIHGLDEISKIYVIEKENGERHLIGMDGLRFLDTNPDVFDLIANLARRVSELERAVKRLSIEKAAEEINKAIVKKRQLTRDEIVRRAIEDVAELTSESSYGKFMVRNVIDGDLEAFDPDFDEVIFEVNRDKRTVVALIRYKEEKTVWARGIAKCAPNDVFNAHIGKAIALRRALGLEVPAEYLNAPQPKEPRSGDVIHDEYYDMSGKVYAINPEYRTYGFDAGYHFGKEEGWLTYIDPEDYERRIRQENAKIIDDTDSTERAAQEAAANDRA